MTATFQKKIGAIRLIITIFATISCKDPNLVSPCSIHALLKVFNFLPKPPAVGAAALKAKLGMAAELSEVSERGPSGMVRCAGMRCAGRRAWARAEMQTTDQELGWHCPLPAVARCAVIFGDESPHLFRANVYISTQSLGTG